MRLYGLLLRLYPRAFRHEYGAEMRAVAARRRRDAQGPGAAAGFWLATLADTVVEAAGVHADLLRQDLRLAARSLVRARGFAATAILVTALGIGATTAAVSVADHVLLRPLPFPEGDRLVKLWQDQSFRGYSRMELSPGNFRDWKQSARAFAGMSAYTGAAANLTGVAQPERLEGARVTTDLFTTLGVQAALGRTFLATDARGPRPLILSASLWTAMFGADPQVLGRTVVLDETPHVVVGVMPATFHFPNRDTEYWTPLVLEPGDYEDRANVFLRVVARLAAGATIDGARAELNVIAGRLERAYPEANARTGATVIGLRDEVGGQSRLMVLALAGASFCLLLIACTNLANLLLARSLQRRRELSVRAAMGAGPERLVRQQLTESLLVAGVGGVLGVALAIAAVPLLARLVPTSLPVAEVPGVDLRLLALAAMVTLATSVGVGIVPAIRVARTTSLDALREGARVGHGRQAERVRSALVVGQVAASVMLLVAAGLLVHALSRVRQVDPGFRADGVLTMRTALPVPAYLPAARREQFLASVLDGVRALPAVTQAAYISYLPMVMRGGVWPVTPEGTGDDPAESRTVSLRLVTPGFFETLGIPLRAGRDVRAGDALDPSAPLVEGRPLPTAAVVSESFARDYLPGLDPLGRRFRIAFYDATIVGVAGDIRVRGLERESEPQVYLPTAAVPDGALQFYAPKDLVLHTTGSTDALVPAVRAIVGRADPKQPISDVRTLADVMEAETAPRRAQVRVLVAFAGVALLLAAVGIHGLLAYLVSSRTREIGVRVALGAGPSSIVRLVLGRAVVLAAAGVVVGGAGAWAAGQALQALLAGVSPADPPSFAAAAGLAFAMALAGSAWPAARALRVDPVVATRAE